MFWVNGRDKITHKSEALLEGWVSKTMWRKGGAPNVPVQFFLGDELVGETITGRFGRFSFPYHHTASGLVVIRVQVKGAPCHPGRIVHLVNLDHGLKKGLVICDVDNTLARFSLFTFMLKRPLGAFKGASEVLNKLSEKYYIVYLTHRDQRFSCLTKHWLEAKDFPPGPGFYWSLKDHPISSRNYKSGVLARIVSESQMPLVMGFGDKTGDIAAYEQAGIPKAFLIRGSEDWLDILEVI